MMHFTKNIVIKIIFAVEALFRMCHPLSRYALCHVSCTDEKATPMARESLFLCYTLFCAAFI